MRNGFIAVVWLLLIGLGIFAWLSTQDYDLSKALRFAGTEQAAEPAADAGKVAEAAKEPGAAVAPTFDIVRVEPDGTAVLAGRAGADADVTVMIDGAAVGTAKADERGEWAVVVDKPLTTGNHSLTISSVAGSATRTSEQSVAIAVPERKDEKPLIVLSQKGEPSKVIQAPESVTTVQTAAPATEPKAAGTSPAATEQKTAEAAPATRTAPAEPAAEAAGAETQQQAAVAPRAESTQPAAPAQPTQAPAGMAKAPAGTTPEPVLALRTVDYDDQGNMVFQGQVAPGGTVRVYVDNRPIADATADGTGVWTLRILEEIEPGNHNLRVDQITSDAQVAARIELPFTRARREDVIAALNQPAPAPATPAASATTEIVKTEPAAALGSDATKTNVAAATPAPAAPTTPAPAASASAPAASAPAPAASAPAEPAPAAAAPATAAPASGTPAATAAAPAPSGGAASTAGTMASAPAATPTPAEPSTPAATPTPTAPASSSESAAVQPPPPPAPAATPAPATTLAPASAASSAAPASQPSAAPATPAPAAPSSSTAQGPAAPAQAPATAQPAPSEPAPAQAAAPAPAQAAPPAPAPAAEPAPAQQVAAAPQGSSTTTTTSGETTVLQRPGRIIIQPGNNLWNISRVIYGQGLSYTTIYQANKEQIRDPDLIYPGQIFETPGANPPEEIAPENRTPMPGAQDNG